MIRFVIAAIAAALLLVLPAHFAHDRHWLSTLPSFLHQTAIFLVFTTSVIFIYLYKINKPDFFVQLYLLTMAVKLLAYGAYTVFMILEDRKGASQNVVFFLVLYVILTVMEIAFLYRKISGQHRQ